MKNIHVVCAIIQRSQGFLIALRGEGERENIWEFPGGKVEDNETYEEALVREIKEELEWDIEVMEHIGDVIDQRVDVCLNIHAYRCSYVKGDMVLHAHHEVRFVDVFELEHYTFEEADKAIIEALQRRYA